MTSPNRSYSNGNLIVDFPRLPKVQFSKNIIYVETLKRRESTNKFWLSREDKRQFKRDLMLDVVRAKIHAQSPRTDLADEDLIQYVGIERLVSDNLIIKSKEERMKHLRAVMNEQERQNSLQLFKTTISSVLYPKSIRNGQGQGPVKSLRDTSI